MITSRSHLVVQDDEEAVYHDASPLAAASQVSGGMGSNMSSPRGAMPPTPLNASSFSATSPEDLEVVACAPSPEPPLRISPLPSPQHSNVASASSVRTSTDGKKSMDLSSFGSLPSPKVKLTSSNSSSRLGSFSLKRTERKDSASSSATASPKGNAPSSSLPFASASPTLPTADATALDLNSKKGNGALPTSNSFNALSNASTSPAASPPSSSTAVSNGSASASLNTSKFSFGSFLRQVTSLTTSGTTSNNGSLSPTSAREAAHEQHKKDWLQLLASGHNYTESKTRARCIKLALHGIPSSVRPDAWKFIIGNQLNITEDLFWIMMGRAQEVKELKALKQAQRDQQEQAEAAAALASNGAALPASNSSSSINTPLSAADKANKEASVALIDTDVSRTFAELKFFHDGGPLQAPLFQVLEAFGCYRPDVGYVQGMSYLAAMLLLNLDTLDAFIALCNLLNQEMYFKFYRMNAAQMSVHMRAFSVLLHDQLPSVATHFEQVGIQPDMFLYEWLLTIFSRSLALDVTHRIWDNFLCQGHVFLFRVALALLRMQQTTFLEASFEDCLDLLHHPPKTFDVDAFFNEHLSKISLSEEKLQKVLAGCEKGT